LCGIADRGTIEERVEGASQASFGREERFDPTPFTSLASGDVFKKPLLSLGEAFSLYVGNSTHFWILQCLIMGDIMGDVRAEIALLFLKHNLRRF
jgi:hypothetical protein